VLRLNYSCEGYGDNVYTIIIRRYKGTTTDVSEDGKTFIVNPVNLENGKTVILALYDGETLVQLQSVTCEGEANIFTTDKAYTSAKVMVWDSLSSLKPVCEMETVK
jgi:hypothetical protein